MKPLVEKLLKSGVIDKHAALMMERWKTLEPGSAELVGTEQITTKKGLEKFAEEIEALLDKDSEITKETPLDWPASGPPKGFQIKGNPHGLFIGCLDAMGRLVVSPMTRFKRGLTIIDRTTDKEYQILEIEFFYKDEKVIAQLLTIE
jgi:hypothetical protein